MHLNTVELRLYELVEDKYFIQGVSERVVRAAGDSA